MKTQTNFILKAELEQAETDMEQRPEKWSVAEALLLRELIETMWTLTDRKSVV